MKALKRRTFLKGIGLAVGTMTLSGVLRGPAILAQPPVVTIGTLLDSTGPLAEFGPAERKGADLAAKHLNDAAKEVLGGPIIKLVHEDPGFPNFAQVVDRAKKLVTVDKAVGLGRGPGQQRVVGYRSRGLQALQGAPALAGLDVAALDRRAR
jgi:hypothetical protein